MSVTTASNPLEFPALAEMGVTRFYEISHYVLRQEGVDRDTLKIYYKRAKGSLLPTSRKYKFGRAVKSIVADGGTSRMENVYNISPFVVKAVAELDRLVTLKENNQSKKARLLTELNHLDQVMSSKIDDLRRQIEAL
ncbi:MAG: DUF3461 family protein [Granulosicoccus sp.]